MVAQFDESQSLKDQGKSRTAVMAESVSSSRNPLKIRASLGRRWSYAYWKAP